MHRPQPCWLPPQIVPQQMQMGMPPQMHLGAAATGSPQHQQHQQYQQHLQCPQHPQHHYVGGCHGQSPLQPAQLGSPPPHACADAPSDAHISEQVTHLLSQRTHFSHTNLPQVLLGTYYGGTYYGQVTRLLKKLTIAQEKPTSGAPSASAAASTAASTSASTSASAAGFGFEYSLGSVLSRRAAPHLVSPAPYLAPTSPHLGEAAPRGEGEYPGGGDNQPPNRVLAESCGQTAGAWGGGGGVGLTDTTPRLTNPLPGFPSSRVVSFAVAFVGT